MGGLHYISALTPSAPTDLSACDCIQPNQHVAWPNRALPKRPGGHHRWQWQLPVLPRYANIMLMRFIL